jgi:hypothetical protein
LAKSQRPLRRSAPAQGTSAGGGRVGGFRRASAKTAKKAQKIAVRVDNDELPDADFLTALSIPTLLKRYIDDRTCRSCLRIKVIDVRNLDLKVQPSPERVFQWRCSKATPWAISLLEHQVNGSAHEISELFLGTFKSTAKPKHFNVEGQGSLEIGDIKLGNDGRRWE